MKYCTQIFCVSVQDRINMYLISVLEALFVEVVLLDTIFWNFYWKEISLFWATTDLCTRAKRDHAGCQLEGELKLYHVMVQYKLYHLKFHPVIFALLFGANEYHCRIGQIPAGFAFGLLELPKRPCKCRQCGFIILVLLDNPLQPFINLMAHVLCSWLFSFGLSW